MKNTRVYVVVGFENQDNDSFNKEIYGVFSTKELAEECLLNITEELEFLSHCEIEPVMIDEFGYK